MSSAIQQCLEDELPVQLHLECKRLCCSMPEMSSLTLSSYTVFAVQRQAGQRTVQQSSWQACSNSYSVIEITHSRLSFEPDLLYVYKKPMAILQAICNTHLCLACILRISMQHDHMIQIPRADMTKL